MISADVLRQYSFFDGMDDESVQAIAKFTEQFEFPAGECFYETDSPGEYIFLLLKGRVESYLVMSVPEYPNSPKEYYLGDVNPESVFGLSALIDPFTHSSTTRASRPGSALRIHGNQLRQMCDKNPAFGYLVMQRLSKALKERLQRTRVQLANTRAN